MKSKVLHILALIGFLAACEANNVRELNIGPSILLLKPNGSDINFANASGDTISISLISNQHNQTELVPSGRLGNLGYDKILAENRNYVMQIDTPYYRFQYSFTTSLSGDNNESQVDQLSIAFSDAQGEFENQFSIFYESEVYQLDPNLVIYLDSLNLISQTYYDVYSPMNKSGDNRLFYYNVQNGIVGFINSDNEVFERIN